MARQAERDIPTLIEKNWRALENARIQYLSTASSVELARENIRLQTVAFQQGQVTSLEVVDARLNLAKVETQRAQTAYHYVMGLAQLLEARRRNAWAAWPPRRYPIPVTNNNEYSKTIGHRRRRHRAGLVGWGLYQAFQPQRLPLQGDGAQEVNVSSKVPGRVGELYVKLGRRCRKVSCCSS